MSGTAQGVGLKTDNHLEVSEDFLVFFFVLYFFNIPDTGAETIVSVIKDVLLKLQLSLAYCYVEDSVTTASNMLNLWVSRLRHSVPPNLPFSDFPIYILWNCCLEPSCTGLFEEGLHLTKTSSSADVLCW